MHPAMIPISRCSHAVVNYMAVKQICMFWKYSLTSLRKLIVVHWTVWTTCFLGQLILICGPAAVVLDFAMTVGRVISCRIAKFLAFMHSGLFCFLFVSWFCASPKFSHSISLPMWLAVTIPHLV